MKNQPPAPLHPFPVADAMKALSGRLSHAIVITMAVGQWDATLAAAYARGWILLELDDRERPTRAYRKEPE